LTTEDYGIVSMFTVLVGLTVPFTGLVTDSAIFRNFYKDDINLPVFVTNGLLIVAGGASIVSTIYLLFPEFIAEYTAFPQSWLFFVVLVSISQVLIGIVLIIWQAQDKPLYYGLFKILLTALNMGIALVLIVKLNYGWEGRVIGNVVAVTLFAFLSLYLLWNANLFKFDLNIAYIKASLSYSTPLIFHVLSGLIITMIDRVFITNMIGISETGIYTVGYQVGMIIGILASSFSKAWTPWLFGQLEKNNKQVKKKIVKITYGYIGLILGLALVLSLIAPIAMKVLVGKDFYSATQFISWIAFGYAFSGMYSMVGRYILYIEKTYLLSMMTVFAAAINITLNYFLIRAVGAIGAAQATTITFAVVFFVTWGISIKIYDMPWLFFLSANSHK
jgi:O-antigen/teichoic acid export membrane protein